jgi:hypothetical protein
MPEHIPSAGRPSPVAGTVLEPLFEGLHIDFVPADPQPSWVRWIFASVVAVVGSLAADAALVAVGKAVFPGTDHFAHFAVGDYAKLTVIGVLIACVGWPVVTRVSSRPRWVFVRAAVAVTALLLVPDLYIWLRGQSGQGVLVLVAMHLAIAVVTYNALVRIAPAGEAHRG